MTAEEYPGTPEHEALLQAIVFYYADDLRILAVTLFGPLANGTWDPYSDVTLAIVLAGDLEILIEEELRRLCKFLGTIGQKVLMIGPDGDDSGYIILDSLTGISLRYHPLEATNPAIIDSLRLLSGQIDITAIKAAGLANRRTEHTPPDRILGDCVRCARQVDIALLRRALWPAIEQQHRLRDLLLQLFAQAREGTPVVNIVQAQADAALHGRIAATPAYYDLRAAQRAFLQLLYILEHDLQALSGNQARLDAIHQEMLTRIRLRQADLHLDMVTPE